MGIKEALQYLVELGQEKVIEINGQKYAPRRLEHIKHPMVDALSVSTLTGLSEYILSEFDRFAFAGNLIHVVSHDVVTLLSKILEDSQRATYMVAEAFSPKFEFGYWYGLEDFNIKLQSCFVRNDDVVKVLRLVGNVQDKAVKQWGDDGVTQQVEAKTGLATIEDVAVPNPVILAPFRTFIEIEQPESKFVFRMRQGQRGPECALFEADGGAWKLEAMKRIKAYLEEYLEGTDIKIIS